MAAGRPIAASCPVHSYLRSLLDAASAGAAFDNGAANALADYIRHLSQNKAEAKRLGDSGRAYMQDHFTPEIISHQYTTVLKQAASSTAA